MTTFDDFHANPTIIFTFDVQQWAEQRRYVFTKSDSRFIEWLIGGTFEYHRAEQSLAFRERDCANCTVILFFCQCLVGSGDLQGAALRRGKYHRGMLIYRLVHGGFDGTNKVCFFSERSTVR